jgi:predicted NBD/HSP70 family sugar kinase
MSGMPLGAEVYIPEVKKSPPPIHRKHRANVLGKLCHQRSISRSELSKATGLSAATISRITKDLVDSEVLREVRPSRLRVGRPSPGLEINGSYRSVLGISLLAPTLRLLLIDLRGEVLREVEKPVDWSRGREGILDPLQKAVKEMLRAAESGVPPLSGVGVALPGQWDRKRGTSISYPRVPGWKDVPIRGFLEEWTGCPVSLIGYAPAMAVAERARRPWGDVRNLLCVEVEDTVAMGVIANGEVLDGASGNAGELGHITVDPGGPLCYCGNRGCLETFSTCSTVVAEFAQESPRREAAPMSYARVVELAASGDPFAVRLCGRVAGTLGIALATALNLFNPELLVLNGRFFHAEERVMEPLRASIQNRALPNTLRQVAIERSTLGVRAPALGAGVTAVRELLTRI